MDPTLVLESCEGSLRPPAEPGAALDEQKGESVLPLPLHTLHPLLLPWHRGRELAPSLAGGSPWLGWGGFCGQILALSPLWGSSLLLFPPLKALFLKQQENESKLGPGLQTVPPKCSSSARPGWQREHGHRCTQRGKAKKENRAPQGS